MNRPVIFVGLNPSKVKIQDGKKLSTHSRLKSWLDYLDLQYVSFTNLTGDVNWNFSIRDLDLEWISSQLEGYNKIVGLGKKTSVVLKKLNIPHFNLPHPSPRNRVLNSKEYEIQQLNLCKQWLYNIG